MPEPATQELAFIRLHRRQHRCGILQNEGAQHDGSGLQQRLVAGPGKQHGDRIAGHCVEVSSSIGLRRAEGDWLPIAVSGRLALSERVGVITPP